MKSLYLGRCKSICRSENTMFTHQRKMDQLRMVNSLPLKSE